MHGEVILPDDDGYDSARMVWNGMINNYPALIIRCATRADVTHAVEFARRKPLPVAVRGGGHSVSGQSVCDGGIVIDLSQMKGIWVDPVTCTARAEAGVRLSEFVRAIQPFGLLTTTGTVAGTGLAGLTLGGGLGWFMGKYGLTIDNLLSVDIVTASGQVKRASATEHPDLFWGVRGGGGNFGSVTAFELQLYPIGPVLSGRVIYPLAQAREVLRGYREYISTLPDELTASAPFLTTPDGVLALAITLCSCGSLAEGERLVQPVRQFETLLADLIRSMPYLKLLTRADAGAPSGRCYYEKARTLKHLSDEAIEVLVTCGARCTSPASCLLVQQIHGAASRVDPAQTAFALREETYVVSIVAAWEGGAADQHLAWTGGCWQALEPFARSGVYVNFLGDEGEEQVRAAYGDNYRRLQVLKQRYDPTNVFQQTQNIPPFGEESRLALAGRAGARAQGDRGKGGQPAFRCETSGLHWEADLESRADPGRVASSAPVDARKADWQPPRR